MSKTWSESEIKLLKEKYLTSTNEELSLMFPEKTDIAIYKKAYKMGMRKTKEIEFQNRSLARKGEKSPNWNGGKKTTSGGYVVVFKPEHPRADKNGYVMEHILVFEKATGLCVPRNCAIHHLNGNKNDNRIENLCLMEFGAHTAFHNIGKKHSEETKEKISYKAKQRKRKVETIC